MQYIYICAYVYKCYIDSPFFYIVLLGKVTGRAISLSQFITVAGRYVVTVSRAACEPAKYFCWTSRFAHQEPARLLQFPRVFYEIHPETGKMRWERSQWKSLLRFRSDCRSRIASCKVKALERCRLCNAVASQFAQFAQYKQNYQKLESKGIKNLYLLCKGRAVGKGQLVAIRNSSVEVRFCLQACLLLWLHQVIQGRRQWQVLKTEENGETFERFQSE